MAKLKSDKYRVSRREFLRGMRWAPVLFLPAPIRGASLRPPFSFDERQTSFPFADVRLTPHYPSKSPLDDVLRLVTPGADGFLTEKYAFEIGRVLDEWNRGLQTTAPALDVVGRFLDPSIEGGLLGSAPERIVRSGDGISIVRRQFGVEKPHPKTACGASGGGAACRDDFLHEIKTYFDRVSQVGTCQFEIVRIEEIAGASPKVRADIRYDFVLTMMGAGCEERIGLWRTEWLRDGSSGWRAVKWQATEETVCRARDPIFVDVTSHVVGHTDSYRNQLAHGADYWRTVLDGASGIDVYGNNGMAVGDFDNDGFDDLYVCQPAGLPNRLYRNRGDGTLEDVTEQAGVGVLDGTACALFADFENKGRQDLLVVCGSGPLLFLNQGDGRFALKHDAFKFAQPPQGTFTHASLADYDGDGRLDVYFCLYSYYLGLDQYHYPVPYFDARNGPPNFLLHNEGDGTFVDTTKAAGLDKDNDRYSFACAWGHSDAGGPPDLYVANDFGRANLYRNNGNGTFTVVSGEAHVEDVGAGMSACWSDYDNRGRQDIYAANMWSAAGQRVAEQKRFHEK